jgi:alpha-tubulin suppressor-like RCC1 family protein
LPVTVSGIADAVTVVLGEYHTCALLSDGSIQCWGDNGYGQVGDSTETVISLPLTVRGA